MSSRCALRITEQGEAGPPAFTAFLGLSRGCGGLGRASLRSLACIRVVRAPMRSLACMGRVWRTASPALRAYMPRALISAPPLLHKTCTRASRIAVFRLDFDARVHVLGEALCGFESLARYRKSPGWVTGTGFERLWRRERGSRHRFAPPSAAAARAALRASLENAPPFLSSAPSQGSNPSPAAEKSPRPKRTQARYSLWRRERDSNPRDAHAPNGFQDRRIQPLCHLSVVGNDSIEYRPV